MTHPSMNVFLLPNQFCQARSTFISSNDRGPLAFRFKCSMSLHIFVHSLYSRLMKETKNASDRCCLLNVQALFTVSVICFCGCCLNFSLSIEMTDIRCRRRFLSTKSVDSVPLKIVGDSLAIRRKIGRGDKFMPKNEHKRQAPYL